MVLVLKSISPFVLAALLLTGCAARAEDGTESRTPVHQLRIYEIFDNNKAAFHQRFADHAARIMTKYDFKIVAMWESRFEDRTEFVYLLEWPDEQTMKARWSEFMADEEWSAIKKKTGAAHGILVGAIEDRTLKATYYSPRMNLLN